LERSESLLLRSLGGSKHEGPRQKFKIRHGPDGGQPGGSDLETQNDPQTAHRWEQKSGAAQGVTQKLEGAASRKKKKGPEGVADPRARKAR